MRGARWLLLAAIVAILGSVGVTYQKQKKEIARQAPPKPAPLPLDVQGKAKEWHLKQSDVGHSKYEVFAKDFSQEQELLQLRGVRLHVYQKDGGVYDRIESAAATHTPGEARIYSEGEVTITLDVPSSGVPKPDAVTIRTSAVTFESEKGLASTDRPVDFTFENGTGKSIGAWYDTNTRELQLRSNVEMTKSPPGGKPTRLEAGTLIYKELGSHILLFPWAKIHRQNSTLTTADAVVQMNERVVTHIEAKKAAGIDRYPRRLLEYSADQMTVAFNEAGEAEKIVGEVNARIVSTAGAAKTTVTADRVDLFFETRDGDQILKNAQAHGRAIIESAPIADKATGPLPATRVLRSDVIEVKMRPGGEEIEEVLTHSPGTVEFLPNHPGQRLRRMTGERISISYGANNVIRSFRAVQATTRTEPLTTQPKQPPVVTSSMNLLASFDEKGQMTRLEQWDNFRYAEGSRKAQAVKGALDQQSSKITLETAARVWDDSGSTDGDRITMNQENGDFTAEGNVSSSQKQQKAAPRTGMLSGDQPVQATAPTMISTGRNQHIRYEGGAVVWQGGNRIKGDTVEIDRENRRLVATGKVETQLVEKSGKSPKSKTGGVTIVRSSGMVYTEADRIAHYTGGVTMIRPRMTVKSLELRAVLADKDAESSLETAYADGKVEIVQQEAGRGRTGTSEHAEYYTAEDKLILRGGNPQLIDSVKGTTRGQELTFFAADDRLLVNGVPDRPATSRLRRK